MFEVTDAAKRLMAGELDRLEKPTSVIRFYHDSEGLHLRLSAAQPRDTSFDLRGRTVFVVDDNLAQRLTDRTLDVKQTEGGVKLSLGDAVENPSEA